MDETVEILETFDGLCDVSEMSTDPGGLVTISGDILARIREKNDDPKFATFVIESGWSKSNRLWGPELFSEVASEINSAALSGEPIVGYKGHIKPENDPYEFPPIQLTWVGAKMLQTGEKAKLAVKAYVRPGTEGEQYFNEGLVKTVSWRGKIAQELFQKGVRVKKFAIESIDLSRPRAAGMNARLVGALTSEMETEDKTVKPEEIAALSANELRAHNSGLVQTIEAEARQPLESKVSEMEAAAATVAPITEVEIPSLKKALGLADDADAVTVLKAAVAFVRDQGRTVRESLIDSVLKSKKLDGDDKNVKLARQVIVGEMNAMDFSPTGDKTKDEQTVTEMVNRVIDSSEDLKEIVSEMESAPPAPPASERGRAGSRELKPGTTTSNLRVRALSR